MIELLLAVALSYFVGGIPTSIITGKVFRGIDIREHGSGNAGATNVFRVLGWKLALPVMLVDVLKGTFATLVISGLALGAVAIPDTGVRLACGVAAVAGHIWTPYAHFRGGKGVGTAFGVLVSLAPLPALFAALIWITIVLFTGYVSLGSITGALTVPVLLYVIPSVRGVPPDRILLVTTILLALSIVFTHRSNIRRLLSGVENRFNTPFVRARNREVGA